MYGQAFRLLRLGPLLVVLAIVAACGGGSDTAGGSADNPDQASTASPSVEGTGMESPAPTGKGGKFAVKTAGLPVGGGSDDDESSTDRCIRVSWLDQGRSPLGNGISVNVATVRTNKKTFKVSGSTCRSPQCQGYVFDNADDDACYVAAKITARDRASASLLLDGQVVCSSAQSKACQDFTESLVSQPITIHYVPSTETTESPSPNPEKTSPTSEATSNGTG